MIWSIGTVANAMKGATEAAKVASWKYGGDDSRANLNVVNQSSYIGDEFHMGLASDIWEGRLNVEYENMDDAYGYYKVGGDTITISDSLLGGGREGTAKLASVIAHEGTHAYGNRVEGVADTQAGNTYGALNAIFGLKADEDFERQIQDRIDNPENWKENTGDTDFWKFVEETIVWNEWDDEGNLEEKSKTIGKWDWDGSLDFTVDGETIPAEIMALMSKDPNNATLFDSDHAYQELRSKSGNLAEASITGKALITNIEEVERLQQANKGKYPTTEIDLNSDLQNLFAALQSVDKSILIQTDPADRIDSDAHKILGDSGLYNFIASPDFMVTSFSGQRFLNKIRGATTPHTGLDADIPGDPTKEDLNFNLVTSADDSSAFYGFDNDLGFNVTTQYSENGRNRGSHLAGEQTVMSIMANWATRGVSLEPEENGSTIMKGLQARTILGAMGNTGYSFGQHVDWRVEERNSAGKFVPVTPETSVFGQTLKSAPATAWARTRSALPEGSSIYDVERNVVSDAFRTGDTWYMKKYFNENGYAPRSLGGGIYPMSWLLHF